MLASCCRLVAVGCTSFVLLHARVLSLSAESPIDEALLPDRFKVRGRRRLAASSRRPRPLRLLARLGLSRLTLLCGIPHRRQDLARHACRLAALLSRGRERRLAVLGPFSTNELAMAAAVALTPPDEYDEETMHANWERVAREMDGVVGPRVRGHPPQP